MEASKTKAWIGAVLVHIVLAAGLIFSVRWKHVEHEPVSVELVTSVAPPEAATPPPAPPAPLPEQVKPPPQPATTAKVVPPPPPPAVKAPPPPPAPNPADIAREKLQKELAARTLKEQEAEKEKQKQAKLRTDAEKAEKDALKKQNDLRARDLKVAQDKAAKESQLAQTAADKLAREAAEKLAAKQATDRAEAAERAARDAATSRARVKSEGDYVAKIRAKVRGNIIADVTGNPEAVFTVVQLPTGEVLTVTRVKSSGNPAYDQAVERAILKSSPLPKPDQPDVFKRELTLKFRPQE